MRVVDACQTSFQELRDVDLDLIIAASGYEMRARDVAQRLGRRPGVMKTAIGFQDRQTMNRERNDRIFKRLRYSVVVAAGNDGTAMKETLAKIADRSTKTCLRILIDYTSMTRVWYAAALEYLRDYGGPVEKMEVYFSYTPAAFARPKAAAPNRYMGPIPGFCRVELPTRPTALIVGLGYEARRASGLVDYVEAAETFAFLADPAIDRRFVREVERNNADLLARLRDDHVTRYPLSDLRATEASLGSLCLGLIKDYRVILAPLGPKPFAILCLLFAAKRPVVDVWRVSSGEGGPEYNSPAGGAPLILRVGFSA